MHLMTLTLKGFQKVEVEHLKYNERMFFGMMASVPVLSPITL